MRPRGAALQMLMGLVGIAACGSRVTDSPSEAEDCTASSGAVCEPGEEVTTAATNLVSATRVPSASGASPTSGSEPAPSTEHESSSAKAAPCDGFVCEVQLGATSVGELEIQVDFRGPYCSDGCGLQAPRVFHVETGLRVAIGRGLDCSECSAVASNPICSAPGVVGRTWDGSVYAPDSTCEGNFGTLSCQLAAVYAPSGRYRAEICSFGTTIIEGNQQCSTAGEQRCESVEFDYPSTSPVVIHFDNTMAVPSDAG